MARFDLNQINPTNQFHFLVFTFTFNIFTFTQSVFFLNHCNPANCFHFLVFTFTFNIFTFTFTFSCFHSHFILNFDVTVSGWMFEEGDGEICLESD